MLSSKSEYYFIDIFSKETWMVVNMNEASTVVSEYKLWARSAWQRDNTESGTQNDAFAS